MGSKYKTFRTTSLLALCRGLFDGSLLRVASGIYTGVCETRRTLGRNLVLAKIFGICALVHGLVLIVPYMGYLPTTIVLVIALAYRLGYRGVRYLGSAALFGVLVVVVFKSLLQVKVPGGAIYEFLPNVLRSFFLTYF